MKRELKNCKNCSPQDDETKCNHFLTKYENIIIRECCLCHFKSYHREDGTEISKEEVFKKYPELLEARKKRIRELEKHVRCSCAEVSTDMWCWDKPWIICEIKTIKEELEGKCIRPMSAKVHIDEILAKQFINSGK